jgi:hypothetical protein
MNKDGKLMCLASERPMVPTCVMTMAEYGLLKDAVLRYPTTSRDLAELVQSYNPSAASYLSPAPRWLKLHAPACCVAPDAHDFLLEVAGPLDDGHKVSQLVLSHLGRGGVSVLVGCETGYSLEDFVQESTRSVVRRLGLFDIGMGVQCMLDATGHPQEAKLTAGKGLQALLRRTEGNQGAVKLRGFPTECLPGNVTCEMTNPIAVASLQTGFGPLLVSAIDRVDILRKTLVTPSYPGFMSFAVSSYLPTSAVVGSVLDTECHMQMSDAVNFCTAAVGSEDPEWTTYLPRALDSLARSSTGLAFAFGVDHAKEVGGAHLNLQLPHHVFRQAAGTAVLIPVGSVHKVSHPSCGASLKLARDFQSPQSLATYLRRDQLRVELLRERLAGKAYISRHDSSLFAHPYVDNSLSRNVVVGSCFIALLSTSLHC